jgi:hypothetical protein
MIQLTGVQSIPSFIRELDLAVAELDRDISKSFSNWTKRVFGDIVHTTPQWSGDLASAWNYSINGIDNSYTPIPNKVENNQFWSAADVYQRGMSPATDVAMAKLAGQNPTWRDVVYINNPAPIAEQVENLRVLIRPVNLVDGRVAMVQYYVDKFNRGELQP